MPMDKPESAIEFVERMVREWANHGDVHESDWPQLIALARRGAAMQKLVEAGEALVSFHYGPTEAKRPDIFQMLMWRLENALPPVPPPPSGEQEHE